MLIFIYVCKYYSPSGDGNCNINSLLKCNFCLQILFPVRGRKQYTSFCKLSFYRFANTIPRQGTETVFVPIFYGNYVTDSLQILFPVRGRSPYTIFYFYLRRQKMNFVYFIFYHLIRELF